VNQRRTPLPELSLVAICAIWGLTFVLVQDAVEVFPVMTFLAYRFLPAAAVVGVFSLRGLRTLSRDGWRDGLVMGAFLTGGYVFQTFGLERTSAANAGFITGLFVVLTPVLGALLLRHEAGLQTWAAAAVSALGLYLLSGAGGDVNLVGDGLVFLCSCSFALHILATDRGARRHHLGALLAVQLGACGLFSLAVAIAGADLSIPRSATVWSALAVTSLLASALAFFVQTYAQRHASPARTALILTSEPVFAGMFAYLLQGETLDPFGWLGAALIMAAIVGVELVPHLRPLRPLPEG
jgi:drug/metabolite transporter (DMT)-like permease